jgi:hypothetical protein
MPKPLSSAAVKIPSTPGASPSWAPRGIVRRKTPSQLDVRDVNAQPLDALT